MKKRKRRSYSEIFITKLRESSHGDQRLFGNKALRSALRCDARRYDRIKAQLLGENRLIVGRGKGGTVGLAEPPPSKAVKIFVAYSHADEQLKNDLLKHLEPLKRLGLIEAWHDRKLKAGDEWDKSISSNLESADVILLLVSIDFINSKYCYDREMYRALERHNEGRAVVIPVILRDCLWQTAEFANLQAVPQDGKPVCSWSDRDEALTKVAQSIRQRVETIIASR